MSPDDQAMLAELRRRGDPMSLRAAERFETYHRMDREAAEYVEMLTVSRTGFTGDAPYVGWKGIGLARGEALDERDRLRAALAWMRDRDVQNGSLPDAYRRKIDEALGRAEAVR